MNELMFNKLFDAQRELQKLSASSGIALEGYREDQIERYSNELRSKIAEGSVAAEASAILETFIQSFKDLGNFFKDSWKTLVNTRILEIKESTSIIEKGMQEFKKSDTSLTLKMKGSLSPIDVSYKGVYTFSKEIIGNSKNLAKSGAELLKICNELLDDAYSMMTSVKDDGRNIQGRIPGYINKIENYVKSAYPIREKTGEAVVTYFTNYSSNLNYGVSIRNDETANKFYVDREKRKTGGSSKVNVSLNRNEREQLSHLFMSASSASDIKMIADAMHNLQGRLVKYESMFGAIGTWLMEKFGVTFAVIVKMSMNLAYAVAQHVNAMYSYIEELGSGLARGYRRM